MNNNIKLKADSSLLHNWKILIAIEAIEQFKAGYIEDDREVGSIVVDENNDKEIRFELTKDSYPLKLQSCENELNKKEFVDLLNLIYSQADIARKNIKSFEDISEEKNRLTNYYFDELYNHLERISEEVHSVQIQSIQNIVNKKFRESNPIPFIKWINSILKLIKQQKIEVEKLKLLYLEKERGGYKAYSTLLSKVGLRKNNQEEIDEIWEAVKLIIESFLKRECCIAIGNMYAECIFFCKMYKSYAVASLEMLERIKEDLNNKAAIEMISFPLFGSLIVLDAKKQQKSLEIWMGGHSVNSWGNAPLSYLQLENKLLGNLDETVEEIFQKVQDCFNEKASR